MRKVVLAICILSVFTSVSFAQKMDSVKQKPSAFISVNIGLGIPTNSFYIDVPGNGIGAIGSYALTGYTINISGGYPIAHSHFSFVGFISYNAEPFDVNQRFMDLVFVDDENQLISSSYSDFKETLLMGGISFSLGRKSSFDFKLLLGDNLCTLAGYSLSGTSYVQTRAGPDGGILTSSLQPSNSSSMAFDFGIDLRIIQKKHFYWNLSSDFMYSQVYVNTIYYQNIVFRNAGGLSGLGHYRVNYNLLSFTTGIGYKF